MSNLCVFGLSRSPALQTRAIKHIECTVLMLPKAGAANRYRLRRDRQVSWKGVVPVSGEVARQSSGIVEPFSVASKLGIFFVERSLQMAAARNRAKHLQGFGRASLKGFEAEARRLRPANFHQPATRGENEIDEPRKVLFLHDMDCKAVYSTKQELAPYSLQAKPRKRVTRGQRIVNLRALSHCLSVSRFPLVRDRSPVQFRPTAPFYKANFIRALQQVPANVRHFP